jgi:hypothetical protein
LQALLLHVASPRRLVEQCERAGLRRLGDELQIHNQRLRDVLLEATAAKDG